MDSKVLQQLLEEVQGGRLPVAAAVERLRTLPFEDLGFARVDHHRQLRQGFPKWYSPPARAWTRSEASSRR